MIELSVTERQQLENGKAVEVTDSKTAEIYVLVRKDVYDQVRRLLYDDSNLSHDELRLQLSRSTEANGWDAPGMDAYDRYDEELSKRCQ